MEYRRILAALFVLLFLSCSNTDEEPTVPPIANVPEGTNLRINFYRQLCFGEGRFQCMLAQEGVQLGTEVWNNFFGGINGFEYEGGFIYNLEVRTRIIENPPADGSSIAYDLVRIISTEAVPCQFENPVQDLYWLQTEIEFRQENPTEDSQYCYITQAGLDSNPIFIYRDCNPLIDKIGDPVFNCFGEFLGFTGQDVNVSSLGNEQLIWSPETFGCNP